MRVPAKAIQMDQIEDGEADKMGVYALFVRTLLSDFLFERFLVSNCLTV